MSTPNGWSTGTYRMTLDIDLEAGISARSSGSPLWGSSRWPAPSRICIRSSSKPVSTIGSRLIRGRWDHPYLARVYDQDGVAVYDHSGEPSELAARLRRITASKDGIYFVVVSATSSLTDLGDDGIGTYRITVSDMSDTALTAVSGQAGVSALTVRDVLQRSSIDAYRGD